MIKVIISGANGRMGKKVYEAIETSNVLKAVCGVDIVENLSNPDYPVYSSFNCVKDKADVIIDFSAPATLDSILDYAINNGCSAVLCSTGYTSEHIQKIQSVRILMMQKQHCLLQPCLPGLLL